MSTSSRIYLDHNATSPARPEVIDAVSQAMRIVGNASAPHAHGRAARNLVSQAREALGLAMGVCAQDIYFTSGGTEGANTAIHSAVSAGCKRLLVSSLDHPASIRAAEDAGVKLEMVPSMRSGILDVAWLKDTLENWDVADGRPFVSTTAANSETGVIQPVEAIIDLVHEHNGLVLVDAVQALGKTSLLVQPDYMCVSAHKIGGPMGIGALYVSPDAPYSAFMQGGGQERRRRAGTINVAGASGFHAALKALQDITHIRFLRNTLEAGLKAMEPKLVIFGEEEDRLPNTSFFAVPDAANNTLMMNLDLHGVSVSTGMACSSGKVGASRAVTAMRRSDEAPKGAIRISLGYDSTQSDVDGFLGAWAKIRKLTSFVVSPDDACANIQEEKVG
ncbi:cysteine desulfurase [Litorimonas taeanensis]|uniref:Cysteine desulfurase n=1 Tax=Litorimonas taeanensis TaxID=568099 RepID=A0A420WK45_9PROT|nr:cysteine desulfurase family protein [Litorimonas taeanensis]RKQ71275.1 cysteine desulfurase [Litorimonas taeanensis]